MILLLIMAMFLTKLFLIVIDTDIFRGATSLLGEKTGIFKLTAGTAAVDLEINLSWMFASLF